jgi:hypothetical protein
MAHWAEINDSNIVLRVLVGDNDDPKGDEGYEWLVDNLSGTWLQTSYNNRIRGNFAGIGFSYFEDLDIFMPPKCHDEATLNSDLAKWECSNPDHEIKIDVEE